MWHLPTPAHRPVSLTPMLAYRLACVGGYRSRRAELSGPQHTPRRHPRPLTASAGSLMVPLTPSAAADDLSLKPYIGQGPDYERGRKSGIRVTEARKSTDLTPPMPGARRGAAADRVDMRPRRVRARRRAASNTPLARIAVRSRRRVPTAPPRTVTGTASAARSRRRVSAGRDRANALRDGLELA